MKKILLFLVTLLFAAGAWAQTNVNSLGAASGWYSDDTRTAAGVVLNGTNSSFQPFFSYLGAPAPSTADDALIAEQIKFGDFYAGSSGGVMILDGTTANQGKSSVRFYGDGTGIGSLNSSFTSSFRWYMEPYPTSRTLGLNLLVVGTNNLTYSLSWVGSGSVMNAWNEFSVNANTDGWRVYNNGAPGSSGDPKTLSAWLADVTYGSILSGATVAGQGFNIGSWQRQCRVGVDWLESSLLNGGSRIEFVGPVHNVTQSTFYNTIQAAIAAANPGNVIQIASGTYEFTAQMNIDKDGISITGIGNVTFQANNASWSTVNGHKHLIGIYAGTEANPVTISNITMNCNSQCFGVNTYNNAYGVLNNVTINGGKGAGLTVNGSTVIATNLNTATNAWGAVNVDPGSGVTTPSVFTLNSGNLSENTQIWSDGANVNEQATVTVSATGYNKYNVGTVKIWTNRPLVNCATITKDGETTIYATIQAAINAAVAGDVIDVTAGTFAENLTINKSLTLKGANFNTACGGRSAESILAPATGLPVSIIADGVIFNGFEITAPAYQYAVVFGNRSNVSILYNNIHDIGTTVTGTNVHAINYTVANASNTESITISYNCLDNISSSGLTGYSAAAIGILQSTSTGVLTGLTISNNTISDVNVNTGNWPTGKLAYGISINVGGNASYLTNGKVVNASVANNTISNLTGFIATGIGLEGNTENAVVQGNTISNLTGYKTADRSGGGYDLSALKFENNRYAGTVTVEENVFNTNTFVHNGTTGRGYAVSNYVPASVSGAADVTCNWFGTANPSLVVDNETLTGKIFNKATCETVCMPFWSSVTGPCDGASPVHNVTMGTYYFTIQAAITAATAGDVIEVAAGTFNEYLTVNKSLTIKGANAGIHPAVGTHPTEVVGTRGAETILNNLVPAADNITVDGIHFLKAGTRMIDTYNNANNFILRNCIVESTTFGATTGVIQFGGGSHTDCIFEFNLFKDKGDHTFYAGGGPYDGLTFQYNKFNVEGDAIFWAATPLVNGVIHGNEFDGTIGGTPGVGYCTVNIGQGGNIQITDNYVHDVMYTAFQVGIIGGSVTGNTFEHTYPLNGYWASAFELWGGQWGTAVSTNVTVAQNTFHFNDIPGAAYPSHGLRLRAPETGSGIDGATIHVSDNKFMDGGVRSDAKALRHQGNQTTSVDADYNYWGSATPNFTSILQGPANVCPWYTDEAMTTTEGTVHNVTQNLYYCAIQPAISAANAGDVIEVAAGTYVEAGQILINKNLTINGADKATTIIKPDANQTNWFQVNAGVTFNLSKVKLDGTGRVITRAINFQGSGVVNDCWFTEIKGASKYAYGTGIQVDGSSSVNITNSTFDNMGRNGIRHSGTGTVSGNTYTGKGAGDYLDYFILAEYGCNITIDGNTVTNCTGVATSDGSGSSAIAIWDDENTTVNVVNNTLTGNTSGIGFAAINSLNPSWTWPHATIGSGNVITGGDEGISFYAYGDYTHTPKVTIEGTSVSSGNAMNIGEGVVVTNITVHNNSLVSTGLGVDHSGTGTLDATCNWWGTVNYNELLTKVNGDVEFVNYLVTSDIVAPVCTGGVWPVHNVTQNLYYQTIQAAVTAATADDVVEVASGTYSEGTISIDKSIDLRGAKYNINPVIEANSRSAGTFTGESVIVGPILVGSNVSNVSINGFYVDYNGTSVLGESVSTYLNNGVSNISIKNNVYEDSDYNINLTPPWGTHKAIITTSTGSSNITIEANLIAGYETAAYLNPACSTAVLNGNKVLNCKYGFRSISTQGLTITNNLFEGSGGLQLRSGWTNPAPAISGLTVTGNSFNNLPASIFWVGYLDVWDNRLTVDVSNNTFEGKLPSAMSATELFALEDHIVHKLDNATKGLATWVPGNLYVTTSSGSIQRGIDAATAGWTVNVGPGTFNDAFGINKSIKLYGANYNISPNTGTRLPETILTLNYRIGTTDLAEIKGFEFTYPGGSNTLDQYVSGNVVLEKNFFNDVQGLFFANTTTISIIDNRCTFTNDGEGIFIAGNYNGTTGTYADIHDNVFLNGDATGFNLSSVSGIIYNNTFDNIDYYGVLVANTCNLDIYQNYFLNIENPDPVGVPNWGAGVRFYQGFESGLTVDVHDNLFAGNYVGISSRAAANFAGTAVAIWNNSITGSTLYGINHMGSGNLSAVNNYWGGCPSFVGEVEVYPYYTTVSGTAGSLVFGGQINNITATPPSETICLGQSVLLTASGGSNYEWFGPYNISLGGNANKTVTPSVPGTHIYTVKGNDSNSCPLAYATIEITVEDEFIVTIDKSKSGTGPYTLTATAGDTYLWNTGANTQSIEVNPASTTTYNVLVTNGPCSASASITIDVVYVSAGANQAICLGGSAQLQATVSGLTPTTYSWSPAGSLSNATIANPIATPVENTTYTVTIDGTYTANVTVTVRPVPVANAGNIVTIFVGQSAVLTGSATGGTPSYSYLWTPGNFTTQAITVSPAVTTTYYLTVFDAFGCSSSQAEVTVTVNDLPLTGNTVTGNVAYAFGTVNTQMHDVEVKLVGSEGTFTGYTSPTGPGNYEIPGVPDGTYTVYLRSPKPWGGVTSADVTAIANHYRATRPVLLHGIKRLAADVVVHSSAHTVNVDDRNAVNLSLTQGPGPFPGSWVFTKLADINSTNYPIQYANDAYNGQGFSTIEITVENGNLVHNFRALCYGDVNGSYNGLKIIEIDTPLVYDGTEEDWFELNNYPNPFAGKTTIRFYQPVEGYATIEVFNFMGNKVKTIENASRTEGEHLITFDGHGLAPGVYIYTLTLKTSDDILTQTGKMVITH